MIKLYFKRVIFHTIKSKRNIYPIYNSAERYFAQIPLLNSLFRNTLLSSFKGDILKNVFTEDRHESVPDIRRKKMWLVRNGNPLAVIFSNTIYRPIYPPIMAFNFDNAITGRSARQTARSPKENFCSPNIVNWLIVFHGCWLHPRKP